MFGTRAARGLLGDEDDNKKGRQEPSLSEVEQPLRVSFGLA